MRFPHKYLSFIVIITKPIDAYMVGTRPNASGEPDMIDVYFWTTPTVTEHSKAVLLGQGAETLAA